MTTVTMFTGGLRIIQYRHGRLGFTVIRDGYIKICVEGQPFRTDIRI